MRRASPPRTVSIAVRHRSSPVRTSMSSATYGRSATRIPSRPATASRSPTRGPRIRVPESWRCRRSLSRSFFRSPSSTKAGPLLVAVLQVLLVPRLRPLGERASGVLDGVEVAAAVKGRLHLFCQLGELVSPTPGVLELTGEIGEPVAEGRELVPAGGAEVVAGGLELLPERIGLLDCDLRSCGSDTVLRRERGRPRRRGGRTRGAVTMR